MQRESKAAQYITNAESDKTDIPESAKVQIVGAKWKDDMIGSTSKVAMRMRRYRLRRKAIMVTNPFLWKQKSEITLMTRAVDHVIFLNRIDSAKD